ncbi:hypothetical protein PVK06_017098 [Gossypium arboreum]|uniref:Uncharacterized protein n=1 Tax=Gossypium arboreum TaxID=29729 RepID=A0ABR0Q1W4_GOSAR|nr:hypothetical protein PVK06_017098 [Gossypium arboreum]
MSGHPTNCGIDRWLLAPAAVVGLMMTTISMTQCDQLILFPLVTEVVPWVELRRTARDSRRYYAVVSFGQSIDVGREGAVDSVCDSGNARNKLDVEVVWLETMDFIATERPEGTTQGGYLWEG